MQRFVIGEQESGYIEAKALEDFLKMQFGSDKNYDIKVRLHSIIMYKNTEAADCEAEE